LKNNDKIKTSATVCLDYREMKQYKPLLDE